MNRRRLATLVDKSVIADRYCLLWTGRRSGLSLVEVLVVLAIIGILLGLMVPAISYTRQASYDATCRNNLRQIGLALHQYNNVHSLLPPGCSNSGPKEKHQNMSWLTRLLPYLEQESLWQRTLRAYDEKPFFGYDPPHIGLSTRMPTFTCPMARGADQIVKFKYFQVAFTSYLGVSGTNQTSKDGFLFLNSRVSLSNCMDGVSNTVVCGERPQSADNEFGWWYAGWGQSKDGSADMLLGARENGVHPSFRKCPIGSNHFQSGRCGAQCDALHFWSYHPGRANFVVADGSVKALSYTADAVLPALATRSGNDAIEIP